MPSKKGKGFCTAAKGRIRVNGKTPRCFENRGECAFATMRLFGRIWLQLGVLRQFARETATIRSGSKRRDDRRYLHPDTAGCGFGATGAGNPHEIFVRMAPPLRSPITRKCLEK
ncbi:hypothetical protein J6500_07345 [Bradyrhizobium sp. WSM 1704]|uniref:hypothetical protein n=1 Tax=Bradyrhizobium semiaridum TaxID=2821404 RepID=UPI001CE357B1|nr:hypothetical protein [Bradyrhizobium semiaridum]MCA6121714.1 hypothetical protein [Bradyrhizobium semiaridum]